MPTAQLPGILLTMGSYYGTLAAARSLGRAGVPVVLADADPIAPTRFSRYVQEVIKPPKLSDMDAYGQWLVNYGEKRPGLVLYPTSDDLVWIIAKYQKDLKKNYLIYQPSEEAMYGLLNKKSLYHSARELGLDIPNTFFPESYEELEELSNNCQYPVLVKPRTQMGMSVNVKGLIARSPAELRFQVEQFLNRFTYRKELLAYDPSVRWPMVQTFHPEARTETYSLAGFITEGARMMAVRGAQKILQHPMSVGVGLAFEGRKVHAELQEKVRKIAEKFGYFGAFEVEFIYLAQSHRYLLMDFNPRFYNQMGFEIFRGLPIPELVYAASLGDQGRLNGLFQLAEGGQTNLLHKWRFHRRFKLFMTTQWLGKKFPKATWKNWLRWAADPYAYDPIEDPLDPLPLLAERLRMFLQMVKHPRSTFRYYFK